MKRLKLFAQKGQKLNYNFWRSYGGAEVDYLEREDSQKQMSAYEIKYGKCGLSRGAKEFTARYKLPVKLINKQNYLSFVSL